MIWAAINAIYLAFVGKLGALLVAIPMPVMGGIMILLFGAIVVVGMNSMMLSGQDLMASRNLVTVSVVLLFGPAEISGLALHLVIPGGKDG